jgi:hypothetical protein
LAGDEVPALPFMAIAMIKNYVKEHWFYDSAFKYVVQQIKMAMLENYFM